MQSTFFQIRGSVTVKVPYQESVLPKACRKRLSVEMQTDFGWYKYVGLDGKAMSVSTYGASAPASKVIAEYGFTVDNVIKNYQEL